MIKLFVSDLDGTLLNRFHKTDRTILKTIDQVIDEGKYFAIATGRNMRYQQFIAEFKNRRIYNICMNGALIYDPQQKVIYEKCIAKDILADILKTFPDINFECIARQHTYLRVSKQQHIHHFQKMNIWMRLVRKPMLKRFLKDCLFHQSDADILKQDILKINCRVYDPYQRQKLNQYLLTHQDKINNAPFSSGIYEITHKDVHKGHAVKLVATLLKIKEDEVAVYGDGGNDIEMLKSFQYSYAPKNADQKILSIAKYVIGHNCRHSVSKHIQKTLKNQSSYE